MKDESKKVYILLSKTKTVPSNLIKLMTREPYCHTSLALDISLDEMYSFARKGVYNPFNSGFISENIEKGIFGKHKGTRCAVYELKVTSKQYDRIQQELARFKKHPDRYGYNFMGVFSVFFHLAYEREYSFFCSQFVASVLKMLVWIYSTRNRDLSSRGISEGALSLDRYLPGFSQNTEHISMRE